MLSANQLRFDSLLLSWIESLDKNGIQELSTNRMNWNGFESSFTQEESQRVESLENMERNPLINCPLAGFCSLHKDSIESNLVWIALDLAWKTYLSYLLYGIWKTMPYIKEWFFIYLIEDLWQLFEVPANNSPEAMYVWFCNRWPLSSYVGWKESHELNPFQFVLALNES